MVVDNRPLRAQLNVDPINVEADNIVPERQMAFLQNIENRLIQQRMDQLVPVYMVITVADIRNGDELREMDEIVNATFEAIAAAYDNPFIAFAQANIRIEAVFQINARWTSHVTPNVELYQRLFPGERERLNRRGPLTNVERIKYTRHVLQNFFRGLQAVWLNGDEHFLEAMERHGILVASGAGVEEIMDQFIEGRPVTATITILFTGRPRANLPDNLIRHRDLNFDEFNDQIDRLHEEVLRDILLQQYGHPPNQPAYIPLDQRLQLGPARQQRRHPVQPLPARRGAPWYLPIQHPPVRAPPPINIPRARVRIPRAPIGRIPAPPNEYLAYVHPARQFNDQFAYLRNLPVRAAARRAVAYILHLIQGGQVGRPQQHRRRRRRRRH